MISQRKWSILNFHKILCIWTFYLFKDTEINIECQSATIWNYISIYILQASQYVVYSIVYSLSGSFNSRCIRVVVFSCPFFDQTPCSIELSLEHHNVQSVRFAEVYFSSAILLSHWSLDASCKIHARSILSTICLSWPTDSSAFSCSVKHPSFTYITNWP